MFCTMEEECLSFRALRGQLLFAHEDAGFVTLDFLLGEPGSPTSELFTVVAAMTPKRRSVAKVLQTWADASQFIEVEVVDRRWGVQWEISRGRTCIVLEHAHPALD